MPIVVGEDGLKRAQSPLVAHVLCPTSERSPSPSADPARHLTVGRVVDDLPRTCLDRDRLASGQESLRHASLAMGAPGKTQIK
jgi:hypothetical protein